MSVDPRMIERHDPLQDLDEALSGELAGSTAAGNKRCQADLAHDLLPPRAQHVRSARIGRAVEAARGHLGQKRQKAENPPVGGFK